MEMTKKALQQICKDHKLYMTPTLNDTLYCNFKGFVAISNLEEYINLKAVFLEGNSLENLEGLPHLSQLKCLYVQQNLLATLEGLGELPLLDTLNISNNQLTSLDSLSSLPRLHTLICTHNHLETAESIQRLSCCAELETLDLQHNKLADTEILQIMKRLPNLKCLYLSGNPIVSKLSNYRKTIISSIPNLSYLDDRPVFERERRCSEAWATGGLDAERAEREKYAMEEMDRERRNFEALQRVREEGFRKRREALGLAAGTTDPFMDTVDDSKWIFTEEPEELRAARERLYTYTDVNQQQGSLPGDPEGAGIMRQGVLGGVINHTSCDEDVKAVLEAQAAHAAELEQDFQASTHESLENIDVLNVPRAASVEKDEIVQSEKQNAAAVPAAKVTVEVGDSSCEIQNKECSTTAGHSVANDSKLNATPNAPISYNEVPGMISELGAIMRDSCSELGSDSVPSDADNDLEELD